MEARDVRPRTVQSPPQLVAFAHELMALGQEHLIGFAQAVAIASDPGAVGFPQLSGQIADEPALGRNLSTQPHDVILCVEGSLPP